MRLLSPSVLAPRGSGDPSTQNRRRCKNYGCLCGALGIPMLCTGEACGEGERRGPGGVQMTELKSTAFGRSRNILIKTARWGVAPEEEV